MDGIQRGGRPSKRRGACAVAVAAVVAAAGLSVLPGCGDNSLPPLKVPAADEHKPLPKWYPEAPWMASNGQSRVFIEGKIVFDTDKAIIRPGSEKVLETLLKFLNEHPEVTRLRIEGHTDDRASDEHNLDLSARRALAVCNWLVDHGIQNTRLIAVGFGKSKPIAPNTVAEGRAENRRTEFHVAELNGHLFGGHDPTAGGYVLDVPSLDERKKAEQDAQMASRPPPPPKPFQPTGDEIKEVKPKLSFGAKAPPSDAAPPPDK